MIDQQQQRDTADERATLAELIAEGAAEIAEERADAVRVTVDPNLPPGWMTTRQQPDDPPSCGTNCC